VSSRPVTAVRRQLYRGAMVLLRAYRYLFRPRVHGVRCVLVEGDQVLLVRHTYGDRRWALPGGLIKRTEPAMETARREMSEELGLGDLEWRDLGRIDYKGSDRARHIVRCFACTLPSREIRPNAAEIGEIAWFAWDRLPRDSLDGTLLIVNRARPFSASVAP
jgi:ADP-ribose pyrophosphatase YjhB (NUDIX family)